MLAEERAWFKHAKNEELVCPGCGTTAALSEYVADGSTKIGYYGFTYAKCPQCNECLLFDLERMLLYRWGEGRKPPLLMIGVGRTIDALLLLVGVYLLVRGLLFPLPIIFALALLLEWGWELCVKRANPDWYHTDLAFQEATNRFSLVGIPMTLLRWVVVAIGTYRVLL